MKKQLFITLLFVIFNACGIDCEKTITAPYVPGFSSTDLHESPQKAATIDLILYNPHAALEKIHTDYHTFAQTNKKFSQDESPAIASLEKTQQLIRETAKNAPLFFVGECCSSFCPLTRKSDGNCPRELFESRATAHLSQKIASIKNRPIQYVSFGTGGVFPDLRILSKALAAYPNAKIDIHFIDLNNGPLILWLSKTRGKIDISAPIDLNSAESLMKNELQKAIDADKQNTKPSQEQQAQIINGLLQSLVFEYYKNVQIADFLKKTFPKASLNFYIYSSTIDYIDFVEKNSMPSADLLTTIDIEDDLVSVSIPAYLQLAFITKQKNDDSVNLWLSSDLNSQGPTFITCSDKEFNGAQKKQFFILDGQKNKIKKDIFYKGEPL